MSARIDVATTVQSYEGIPTQAHAVLGREAERPKAVMARLDQLGPGPAVRRERIDLDHVNALAERGEWPPILVTGPKGRIIDGNHRAAAARRLGLVEIEAHVFDGDDMEALEAATKANVTHGLPLSLSERKSIAKRFIAETNWSDRRIASGCGLSHQTVARLRPQQRAGGPNGHLRGRTGTDGKTYRTPEQTEAQRSSAAKQIEVNPAVSNRQVAKQTGLSPRTVADVRGRVSEGRNPAPERLRGAANPAPKGEPERKLRAVPDPEPEPEPEGPKGVTAGDVLGGTVPSNWMHHPAASRTNEEREFMRFMNHWGRAKKFEDDWSAIVRSCPPDAREQAIRNAEWMAEQWNAFAVTLRSGPRMEVTE